MDNGRLPDSVLAPITGGRLHKDAAAAWNAMCQEARRKGLPVPVPDGPASTYRTFEQQVELRNYWCGQGNCGNAAVPGTSNHGLGLAVDCSHADPSRHRATVDQIGEYYGWGPIGSDAPWEEWHMKWQPVWHGLDPGPNGPEIITIPDDPDRVAAVLDAKGRLHVFIFVPAVEKDLTKGGRVFELYQRADGIHWTTDRPGVKAEAYLLAWVR